MDYLWLYIISFIGLLISSISSILVLISICSIKYKDISLYLRIYSTVLDLIFIAYYTFNNFEQDPNEILGCMLNAGYTYSNFSHGLWFTFMSYCMQKIIYCQGNIKISKIHFSFMLVNILSILMASSIFIAIGSNTCLMISDNQALIYIAITCIAPDIIFFVLLTYFYYRIKVCMQKKVFVKEGICISNSELVKKMYAYPLLFSGLCIADFLIIFQLIYVDTIFILSIFRIIFYSFYPFMNSLVYGHTQSARRSFKRFFSNSEAYNEREELLSALRCGEFLLPRFYLDMLWFSEDDIFDDLVSNSYYNIK